MLNSMAMKLKEKILGDLLGELDDQDGEKLKPKAEISVTAVKPEMGMEEDDKPELSKMAEGAPEDDDEDLKALMQEYMAHCK